MKFNFKNIWGASGQDGGIGRYALLPCTTKRITTNSKTKNNQNCQRIELHGSLTTKKLKKKHSSRLVGGAEMGSQGGENVRQGSSWQTGQARWWLPDQTVPHSHVDKLGGTTGELDRPHNPGFQHRENEALKSMAVKTSGVCSDGRNYQYHRWICWRHPRDLRMYSRPLTQESAPGQHLKGHNLLMGNGGSDWKQRKNWASTIVPSLTPPPHTVPQHSNVGHPALVNT